MRGCGHESGAAAGPQSKRLVDVISDIWLRNLGPKGRGANANLVRIGVGAVRIFRMLDDIERELGVTIPIGTALKLGTVQAIATAIETNRWPTRAPSILLKDGQDGPPLYLLPGVTGLILELCSLASEINYPGKIWGLHMPGYEGETPEIDTVGGMAVYLADRLPCDPDEPANIIGYSLGAFVGLEMARLLRQRGRRVGFVGMIDPLLAERQWPATKRAIHLMRRTRARLAATLSAAPERRLAGFSKIARLIVRRLIGVFYQNHTLSTLHEQVPASDDRVKKSKALLVTAFERYAPRPVDFPVLVFKAKVSVKLGVDPEEVWRPVSPNFEFVEVDGSHTTAILRPHARGLAAELTRRLQASTSSDLANECRLRANAPAMRITERTHERVARRRAASGDQPDEASDPISRRAGGVTARPCA